MAEPPNALQTEEVDFLLGAPGAANADEPTAPEAGATLQGDLTQVHLADIFQTVAASQMAGRLRVYSQLDQRDIFFRDGLAFNLVPPRIETKRLGQQLIRAGILTVDELRSALLEHKKSRVPLTRVLVDQGLVDSMRMAELVIHICAEDLYSLFTWTAGSFEFFKGEVTDPVLLERLEQMQPFEVNGLLLEVARRSDEWQRILDALRSTDELLVAVPGVDPSGLSAEDQELLAAVDGSASIRELGESTLLGLFETCRRLRNLFASGFLAFADTSRMLEVAEQQIRSGDLKFAAATIQTCRARGEALDDTTLRYVANLLERCGEKRLASNCLIQHAYTLDDAERMLELAREARRLDPRSAEVLQFLQGRMLESETAQPDELVNVTGDLADALENDGRLEDGLNALLELERLIEPQPVNVQRKARLLHRLGRSEEAIETLLALAEQWKQQKASDRLVGVYEQILKIDYRRKDIARALKQIHAAGRGRRLRIVVIASAVVLLLGIGGWAWKVSRDQQAIREVVERVQVLLAGGDVDGARQILDEAMTNLGAGPELESLGERIQTVTARTVATARAEREAAIKGRVTAAIDHLDRGEVGEALDVLDELMPTPDARRVLEQSLKTRLTVRIPQLEALGGELTANRPRPPEPLQTEAVRRAVLAAIEKASPERERRFVEGLLAARADARLAALLPAAELERLLTAAGEVAIAMADVESIRLQYVAALDEQAVARRLDPVFIAAREHEKQHDFEAALKAYRKLADEYHTDDELRAHIRDQVEKFAGILRYLEVLREATRVGDFKTAQSQLRALQRNYPDIPFADLTRLPFSVETRPPGATVRVDGTVIGTSPMSSSYVPGQRTRIRIELDGFLTEETILTGDEVGIVRSLLAPTPAWSVAISGPAHGAPVPDGKGHLLLADRNGCVTKLEAATGRELWCWSSGDLSGLLPAPLVLEDRLIVASVDGTLRALDLADGRVLWTRDDFRTEAEPVAVNGAALIATLPGELHLLAPATGQAIWKTTLPGAVQATPVVSGERILIGTTTGVLVAIEASSGKQLWEAQIGSSILAPVAVEPTRVFVAAADGRFACHDQRSGARLWHKSGLGELLIAPVWHAGRITLASDRRLFSFRADGNPGPTWLAPAPITRLQVMHGKVYVCRRDGSISVLAHENFEPLYLLRGSKGSVSGLVGLPDGRVIAGFEDRRAVSFPAVR